MSNSVRPHRRQPTRLRHPWDSPGKNTGVGCHFLLQYFGYTEGNLTVYTKCQRVGSPRTLGGAGGGPDDPPDFPPRWLQPPGLQTPPSATLTSAPKLFSNCAYTGPIFQPCWVTQCSNTPTLSRLHTCIQALLRGHLGPLCLHGMRTVLPVGAPPVSSRLSIPRGEMKPFSETSLMMFIMMLCVHVLNALLTGDFLKGQDSWFYLCISRSQPNT